MYDTTYQNTDQSYWFTRLLTTIAGSFLTFMVSIFIATAGFQVQYDGRIYPGVSIAGMDVTGKELEEVYSLLANKYQYPLEGLIGFEDGGAAWVARPAELGLRFDFRATVNAAYQLGRTGNQVEQLREQLSLWQKGVTLPVVVVYDEALAQDYLQKMADIVNKPTIEAHLGLNGLNVEVYPGQVGRTLDIPATLQQLQPQFLSMMDGLVTMVIKETPPVILDASEQAEKAKLILSAPLVIRNPDVREGQEENWVIEPETLAGMLVIQRTPAGEGSEEYQIVIRTEQIHSFLDQIAPSLALESMNARFIFNDDTHELEVIEPHVEGRKLLVAETVAQVNATLQNGEHTVDLMYDYISPAVVDDRPGSEYGITELVSSHTSYFRGSSRERVQNIQLASSYFHGIMVPPGATFSMAEILDDISLDAGFAEALIIYGDRTIKGVGGGVCQVSTTFFRTVFFGGFQINERHPHAYRVYYYEQNAGGTNTNLAGLDAAVFVPVVDFKFTNDSPYWILMETYVNTSNSSLTWKFYSTSDGRSVEWSSTGLTNRTPPPEPLYMENADLAKGVIRQIDWAVEGADVTVTRVVSRDGNTIHHDVIKTFYRPWRSIYEYGPGTEDIPSPESP